MNWSTMCLKFYGPFIVTAVVFHGTRLRPLREGQTSLYSFHASCALPRSSAASAVVLSTLKFNGVHYREARGSLKKGWCSVHFGRLPFGEKCTVLLGTVVYTLPYDKSF